jgi:aminoglycoside phosphotransferase (APT) family kinase protein
MSHVEGVVATTETPPAIDNRTDRRRLAELMVDMLADLHAVDPLVVDHLAVDHRAGGPGRAATDLGGHLHRFARMIGPGRPAGELDELLGELVDTAPVPGTATIVHGDFRLGNLMLAPVAPPRIVAVLDWELATVGDPLRDLGYFLATYAVPGEPPHALTALSSATLADGYPGRDQLARRYAARSGRDLARIDWYLRMALWKVAVLFEHQSRRAAQGVGDPYYAWPGLVEALVTAARQVTTGA